MRNQAAFNELKDSLPDDHSKQATSQSVATAFADVFKNGNILDLGCGDGRSLDFFRQLAPMARWVGVDIEESPEVSSRTRSDGEFVVFNGIDLPFDDGFFDLIFCHQVLEHVRYPELLLKSAQRVLARGGILIGSTSQLEPYHSYSFWNYTFVGFKQLLRDAGLKLVEIRPGIDGPTLIQRSYLGRPAEFSKYFSQESPLNQEIEQRYASKSAQRRNFEKLLFCGHFVFAAVQDK